MTKIIWAPHTPATGNLLKATAVQYLSNNRLFTVNVTKEVIVSAGTIGSPKILELSGVGNATYVYELSTMLVTHCIVESLRLRECNPFLFFQLSVKILLVNLSLHPLFTQNPDQYLLDHAHSWTNAFTNATYVYL